MGVRFLFFVKNIANIVHIGNNFHGSKYGRSFYKISSSDLTVMVNSDGSRSIAFWLKNLHIGNNLGGTK